MFSERNGLNSISQQIIAIVRSESFFTKLIYLAFSCTQPSMCIQDQTNRLRQAPHLGI